MSTLHSQILVAFYNGAELRGLPFDLRGLCLPWSLRHHLVKRRFCDAVATVVSAGLFYGSAESVARRLVVWALLP